ncbi:hypothetical protein [Nannocystis punicea]|uniref:Lipoprotein n=1 Tax=Nannocystis punicea TaxID=2995304 RepID=A0ABY7HG51_9BACT|nr:hypothetical protein [Nannocystis poenicansa]WAS98088.1 hypothetical protein O0S08_18270 [Nannocystis poenicansa]
MSHRPAVLVVLLLALPACGDDSPPATGEEGACPLTAPTLLAAAPESFVARRDTYYDLAVVGDELLFTFDSPEDPDRVYWRKSLCGGEPERYAPMAPGLHNVLWIHGPDGPLVYANDRAGSFYLIDDLGDDAATPRRRITGLPAGRVLAYSDAPYIPDTTFVIFYGEGTDNGADLYGVAGVDADYHDMYTHAGDPDVPAWHLGDSVVRMTRPDQRLLLQHDDGTLEWASPRTQERELLLAGVRYFELSPDGSRLLWQPLGDGGSEPVYLRDLDGGDDLQLGSNTHGAQSWHPAENNSGPVYRRVGTWSFTLDGAYALQIGLDGSFAAAVRTDTGEPVEVPAHLYPEDLVVQLSHVLGLRLGDPSQTVAALWDIETGEVREWYRGDHPRPYLSRLDGDLADIFLGDVDGEPDGRLVRVDLRTGDTVELFASIPRSHVPGAPEYIAFTQSRLVEAPFRQHVAFYPSDILAIDPATGARRRLADDVPEVLRLDEGWIYLDLFSDEPGVRALPFPKDMP